MAPKAAPPAPQLTTDLLALGPTRRLAWMVRQSGPDLAAVFAASARDLGTPFGLFADDPVGFIEVILRSRLWSRQREVARSVEANKRTAVPSAHAIGKTFLAGRIVAWWVAVHPPGTATVVTTATRFRQVKLQLWPHIRRVVTDHGLPGHVDQVQWKVNGDIVAWGFSPGDYDETAFSGIHNAHVLGVVDEAGGIPPVVGQGLESLMTGGHSRLLVIGNPPVDEATASPWFEERCESEVYNVIRVAALDAPLITGEAVPAGSSLVDQDWVDDQIREHGADSRWVQARVYARFPKGGADKAIPAGWVEEALDNADHLHGVRVKLGIDIAADGGDEFVIARTEGFVARVVHFSSGEANENPVDVAGVCLREIKVAEALARELDPSPSRVPVRVKIDAIGLGWGVAGILSAWRAEGLHAADIIPVNVSETPGDPEKFANQRAEMWWAGRAAVQPRPTIGGGYAPGEWHLDIDKRTAAQLSRPARGTTTTGRIRIEAKKDIKRKGMGSPDRAEAILLAIYEPPGPPPVPEAHPQGIPSTDGWSPEDTAAFNELGGWSP